MLPLVVEIQAWQAHRSRFFLLFLSWMQNIVCSCWTRYPKHLVSLFEHIFFLLWLLALSRWFILWRGGPGMTRLDVTLGWKVPLGQPAGLPTRLKSRLMGCQVCSFFWKESHCVSGHMCWGGLGEDGVSTFVLSWLVSHPGSIARESWQSCCSGYDPVTDPASSQAVEKPALPSARSAGWSGGTNKSSLWKRLWRAALPAPWRPSAELVEAGSVPSPSPFPAPSRENIHNRGWRRSDPLSGCLSTLAPVAEGREGWAEAAGGSLYRSVGGSRKMANKVALCEMWRYKGNAEAVEGKPLGKVNVKTEQHWRCKHGLQLFAKGWCTQGELRCFVKPCGKNRI